MGQALGVLRRHRRPHLPPPLLCLPVEVILQICDHLHANSTASTAALAVTCKTLFSVVLLANKSNKSNNNNDNNNELLLLPQLRGRDLTTFLCYLEKDLSDNFYFCSDCQRLHRFCLCWRPCGRDMYIGCRLTQRRFFGNKYQLGWHHVRLVTNRYRLDSNKGLPLRNLQRRATSFGVERWRVWQHAWSAKIIHKELFLSACHTLDGRDEDELLRAVGHERPRVCSHIRMSGMAARRPAFSLTAAREVTGSCEKCPTDYATMIEWLDIPTRRPWYGIRRGCSAGERNCDSRRWKIIITTYHQVGDGESMADSRWLALTGALPKRRCENAVNYPSGSIMKRWRNA